MPSAVFYGLPHSESEDYFVKSSTIRLQMALQRTTVNALWQRHGL